MSKLFEKAMGIIAWLQIVASPVLLATVIGGVLYFRNPTPLNLTIAIGLVVIGLIIGVRYANKIWKTKGTMWFVSQLSATPDLDQNQITEGPKTTSPNKTNNDSGNGKKRPLSGLP